MIFWDWLIGGEEENDERLKCFWIFEWWCCWFGTARGCFRCVFVSFCRMIGLGLIWCLGIDLRRLKLKRWLELREERCLVRLWRCHPDGRCCLMMLSVVVFCCFDFLFVLWRFEFSFLRFVFFCCPSCSSCSWCFECWKFIHLLLRKSISNLNFPCFFNFVAISSPNFQNKPNTGGKNFVT